MRALGPGSVSSFLKIILDVFYYILLVILGGLLVAALAGALLSFNQELLSRFTGRFQINGDVRDPREMLPILGIGLAYLMASVGGVLAIVSRLRMIFKTLTAGDPFHPDNIKRLQFIGFALGGLELARYVVQMALASLGASGKVAEEGINFTAWFAVLVVFVLAEVFREGARLRREAELTI